jgi:Cdc6-like AAA superfamily ATPase
VSKQLILHTSEVNKLERLIEEANRSTEEGVRRFVEPASGTLDRATSRQHHLVFGRRGSGKSSLLRKTSADLTVDRRPIAFVDLETFKGHEYPDVLLSILIKTFSEFAEWLETAAIAPANKTSFWSRLFGTKPTRPALDKGQAKVLSEALRKSVRELRDLLFSEDDVVVEAKQSNKITEKDSIEGEISVGVGGAKLGLSDDTGCTSEDGQELTKKYTQTKLNHLHRHILDYQELFRRMATLSGGDAFLFLDDLYHIPRRDQAHVIDYFHRIGKGNRLWIKIGTIRHRTQWYINGDPPIGTKIGDDIGEIDLDLTLEKYSNTRAFLGKILDTFLGESGVRRDMILTDGALDRLVLASGGVTRDFLGIFRRSILIARERGDTARGQKVGVEDVNAAAGEYDSSKREELSRDTLDESQRLEEEFTRIGRFVKEYSNANVFLLDKSLPDLEIAPIEELVDLRLIHRVKSSVTVGDRPGKKYEAFMLDVSQYTAARKKRELEIIEFWRAGATDSIRRTGLIYKEFDGQNVITKNTPEQH